MNFDRSFVLPLLLLPALVETLSGQGLNSGQGPGPISGAPSATAAPQVLARGEVCRVRIVPAANGTVKLFREAGGGPSATARAAVATPSATFFAQKKSANEIEFTLPLKTANGRYRLQLETSGGDKSGPVAVTVVDPKIKVTGNDKMAKMGETVTFALNHCPPTAKVFLTRVTPVTPPKVWWAPYRSNSQTSCMLTPAITKRDDGSVWAVVTPPPALGGGLFQARIKNGVTESVDAGQVLLVYPPVEVPNFSLRYNGIDCLVDTNEIGDDEVYPIFVTCLATQHYDLQLKQWYPDNWTKPRPHKGPVHLELNKGKSRSADLTILSAAGEKPFADLGLAVILQERDDDQNQDLNYYVNNMDQQFQSHQAGATPSTIADRAKGAFYNARNASDFIDDDLIDIVGVPLENAKQAAMAAEGWHAASVTLAGDGGKFRLRFSVRCDPWKKGPPQPYGPQQPFTGFPGSGGPHPAP